MRRFAHFLLLALPLVGCSKVIGDQCNISTDCSSRGDRVCDTSQPGGYCTQLGCRPNGCPDNAACVLFGAAVPRCEAEERELSRAARSLCMQGCDEDGDCRDADYVCVRQRQSPWNARVLDDDGGKGFCAPRSTTPAAERVDAGVCQTPVPMTPIDSGVRVDAAADASAGADAGRDASDAGTIDP